MQITSSQEEYIKTIYILSKTEKEIRVTDIAKKLKITKPSVNRAIKNLAELNLIKYQTYGEIKIRTKGKELAQKILKKEDTLKIFLTGVLGIEANKAEEEAISMKHAISQKTEEKLESYINKLLSLDNLECNYDENNEKCKKCTKIAVRNRIKEEMNQRGIKGATI